MLRWFEQNGPEGDVVISSRVRLARNLKAVSYTHLEELEQYPYLSFEQGEHNSFYFSEEIFSAVERKKNIRVRDRATLFNLLIGLNGYTAVSYTHLICLRIRNIKSHWLRHWELPKQRKPLIC